ncbi:MAG: hypothetical protein V9G29_04595 [Burkholderiaceae bacterium]
MSSFRLRPRFSHVIDIDVEGAGEMIAKYAREHADRCEVKSFPGYVSLHVVEKDTQYWSPRLSLSLEPEGEGKTRVDGTYGPSTNVWAVFLYGYMLVGSVGAFSGVLGGCQFWLGMQAWGQWIVTLMLLHRGGDVPHGSVWPEDRSTADFHATPD